MADALYDFGRNEFLKGKIDWENDTIKVVLVDTADYTVDLAADEDLADIPGAARVATATLTGATASAGVGDAADTTLASVTGDESEALVIYKDTGVEATSTLIAYIDSATGFPVTPAGTNLRIYWDAGANKIFKL